MSANAVNSIWEKHIFQVFIKVSNFLKKKNALTTDSIDPSRDIKGQKVVETLVLMLFMRKSAFVLLAL